MIDEYTPAKKNRFRGLHAKEGGGGSIKLVMSENTTEVDDMLECSYTLLKALGALPFQPHDPILEHDLRVQAREAVAPETPKVSSINNKKPSAVLSPIANSGPRRKLELGLKRVLNGDKLVSAPSASIAQSATLSHLMHRSGRDKGGLGVSALRERNRSFKSMDERLQTEEVTLEGDEIIVFRELHTAAKAEEKHVASLKGAFKEFYRGLFLILNFVELNAEAFDKAMKKYDKLLRTEERENFMTNRVQRKDFSTAKQLRILIVETENLFCKAFFGNDRRGMRSLRMPWEKRELGWSLFRLGLLSGLSMAFFVAIAWFFYVLSRDTSQPERLYDVLRTFRFFGLCILMSWVWGVDIWLWKKYRINYAFIFEFNMRSHIEYQQMLEAAATFTVVWMTAFLVYFLSQEPLQGTAWMSQLSWRAAPITLCSLTVLVMILFQLRAKFWLLRGLARIIAAPFMAIRFRDFFLADQLCSLVLVFNDLQFTICFFVYGAWTDDDTVCSQGDPYTKPLIAALPYIWRLLQCLRRYHDEKDKMQLWNGGKYVSSICIVMTSTLRGAEKAANGEEIAAFWTYLWLGAVALGTCYTYVWDVKFDWGLGAYPWNFKNEAKFLKPRIMYNPRVYYLAIVSNFVMRLMWTFTISPSFAQKMFGSYTLALTILASVEIMRRGVWNLFRLEAEQLSNIGKFRAVHEMPLPLTAKEYHIRVFAT
eukprot:TRINITY_DN5201_c0_g1_i3.p1 TRINITY_DN5201_c0_g1~~TRINITY_DN5201_c0_g1_i3.p1  ORF type:complete len:707 (+),score=60.15 TRINITY_DN5201_c0_g1_i3:309-2429(+)